MRKKQKRNRGPRTAAEIMEMLGKDEGYQKRMAEREQKRREKEEALEKEQKELIEELHDLGIYVSTVEKLESSPAAIPVLLKHLSKSYSDQTEELIARALEMPEAMNHWEVLLDLFENGSKERKGQQIGLACTLSEFARKMKRYEETLRILRNEELGDNRIYFLEVLALSKDPEMKERLKEFVDHPTLGEQTRWYLKNPGRRSR